MRIQNQSDPLIFGLPDPGHFHWIRIRPEQREYKLIFTLEHNINQNQQIQALLRISYAIGFFLQLSRIRGKISDPNPCLINRSLWVID